MENMRQTEENFRMARSNNDLAQKSLSASKEGMVILEDVLERLNPFPTVVTHV